MGYYSPGSSGGGSPGAGHNHPNKAVLDQITSVGSGKVITDAERQALYIIAQLLEQHLGITIPELQQQKSSS